MKKILALALALMLCLCSVAFADTAEETYTDMSSVTVSKTYKLTNAGTISPAETFSFSALTCTGVTDAADSVTAENAPVPTIGNVSYAAGEAGSANAMKDITITLPEYTSVGIYTYTFNEVAGTTAGVTYHTDTITLVVTVIEQNGKIRVAAVHTEGENEAKSDDFDNEYSAGSLTVGKTVTGTLGDKTKEFTVKVTFTAPDGLFVNEEITYTDDTAKSIDGNWTGTKEVEIVLVHGETVQFENIPYGVTYSVVENNYETDGYEPASYDGKQSGTIESAAVSTTITNHKDGEIDTGIALDSAPYMIVLALVVVAGVMMMKKRSYNA